MTYNHQEIIKRNKEIREQKRIDKFMMHIQINKETGCWIWIESVGQVWGARPRFCQESAFIWAWKNILKQEIPKDRKNKQAHHVCENGECVNPNHLEWKTKEEHREFHFPKLVIGENSFN